MPVILNTGGANKKCRQMWIKVAGVWRKVVYSWLKAGGVMRPASNYRSQVSVLVPISRSGDSLSATLQTGTDTDVSANGSSDLWQVSDLFSLSVSRSGVIRTAELRVVYPFPPNTNPASAGVMIFPAGGGAAVGSFIVKDFASVGGGGITIRSQSSYDGSDPGNNRGFGASIDNLLANVSAGTWRVYVYVN